MELPEIPRLEDETKKAYEALLVYVRLGPTRSQKKVSDQLGKSIALTQRWSGRYEWVRRALLYDTELDRRESEELSRLRSEQLKVIAKRRLQVRDNDWQAAQEIRKRARELQSLPTVRVKNVRYVEVTDDMVGTKIPQEIHMIPAGWRQRDIMTGLDIASKLERLATDMPTENIDVHTATPEETAARAVELAKATLAEMMRKYEDIPKEDIALRVAKQYGVDPASIISSDMVS